MTRAALGKERLVLVTGKGGVGKSTAAAALALSAARQGRRVLLAELGARMVSAELLGAKRVLHTPTEIDPARLPGLWVAHLDAHASLKEYLTEQLHVPRLVSLATDNRVLARLWQAAPSVNELSLLNTLYQHERALGPDGRPRFELLVVDLPATGHALATLGVPRGAVSMIRVGSLAERARAIDGLLHDQAKTAVCIVTLPEALPVNESIELAERLERKLGIAAKLVVINRVLPDLFEPAEHKLLDRLSGSSEVGVGQRLIDAVAPSRDRRALQEQRIAYLKARIVADFVEIPEYALEGTALVDTFSRLLSPS
jgi:arsenite/tail-anchored protein-transporting ATPase